MELVAIVISLALLQYSVFGMLVGKARGTYEIKAPAITLQVHILYPLTSQQYLLWE